MRRYELSDREWERIEPLTAGKAGDSGVTGKDNRQFVNAVLWIARTGAPWRDLPERYGQWHRVYRRFNRWAKKGVWLTIFEALAAKSPGSLQLIGSSIGRAHQHAAAGKRGARITPSAVLVED